MGTRVYLLLCLPVAVGLSVLAFPFVEVLTAPEYYEGSRIVGPVVFSSFIWGLAHIAMMGLTIGKQARRLAVNQMLAAGIHVGLQFLLVPRFGYTASAVSTLVGYIALLVLEAKSSGRYLTWRFPFATLRNAMVASAIMGVTAWALYRVSGAGGQWAPAYLLLSVAVAVPTYALCLVLLGEVDESERRTAAALWGRVIAR
jgi:O-antigen/teichoic acid export membrane protein